MRHHLADGLVGARNLVDHARVLAALDALGLALEIRTRELALRLRAAHAPPGAVRARAERFGIALAAHDERARTHAAGDDAHLAEARPDCALAPDHHALAVMRLARDVVVVALDRLADNLERRHVRLDGGENLAHHLAAVCERVFLRPAHGPDVLLEDRRALP